MKPLGYMVLTADGNIGEGYTVLKSLLLTDAGGAVVTATIYKGNDTDGNPVMHLAAIANDNCPVLLPEPGILSENGFYADLSSGSPKLSVTFSNEKLDY